jgi:hypothetical protein
MKQFVRVADTGNYFFTASMDTGQGPLEKTKILSITPVAQFLVPDWGYIVDSAIGLSYQPAGLHRLEGRYDNAMPESTISPQSRTKILTSVLDIVDKLLLLRLFNDWFSLLPVLLLLPLFTGWLSLLLVLLLLPMFNGWFSLLPLLLLLPLFNGRFSLLRYCSFCRCLMASLVYFRYCCCSRCLMASLVYFRYCCYCRCLMAHLVYIQCQKTLALQCKSPVYGVAPNCR